MHALKANLAELVLQQGIPLTILGDSLKFRGHELEAYLVSLCRNERLM